MQRYGFGIFVWIFTLLVAGTYFTTVVFADEFDSPELRKVWTWDDPNDNDEWSLTEKPGWFRFKVDAGQDTWIGRGLMPMLIQPSPIGDYTVETHIKIDDQLANT